MTQLDQFAKRYGLDPVKLRHTVNLAASITATMQGVSTGPHIPDLYALERDARRFHSTLKKAMPESVDWILATMGNELPLPNAERRANAAQLIRDLEAFAAAAGKAVAGIEKTEQRERDEASKRGVAWRGRSRAPRSGQNAPPAAAERGVVAVLARLWHDTHGEWPAVHDGKTGKGRSVGKGSGAEFVRDGARLVGVDLEPARLRTTLAHARPGAEA